MESSSEQAPRASVLDAIALDGELEALLLDRFSKVWGDNRFVDSKSALRALLLALGGDSAPGEALLRLRRIATRALPESDAGAALDLSPARSGRHDGDARPHAATTLASSRRLLLGCLVIIVPWTWAHVSRRLAAPCSDEEEERRRARWLKAMRRVEGFVALASLLVTLRYLYRGGAPTLPMLLCGVQLVPMASDRAASLPPAFDFMEQQVRGRAHPVSSPNCTMAAPLTIYSPPPRALLCRSSPAAYFFGLSLSLSSLRSCAAGLAYHRRRHALWTRVVVRGAKSDRSRAARTGRL